MQRLVLLALAIPLGMAGCATGSAGGLKLAELPPGVTPVDGARVVVTADQLRGGVNEAVSLQTRLDAQGRFQIAAALDWLERLRDAHNAQAATRFGLVPDSVDLWLDPTARMGTLRLLTVALVQAGFKHVALVGSTPTGARTAVTLRPGYLPSRASTNLSVRWRFDAARGVEVGRVADGQYVAENAPKCPLLQRANGRLDASRLAPFAKRVCSESKDGRIGLGLAALPSTSWGEVADLASAALGASGCHAFVYLEPVKAAAIGCLPRLEPPVTGPPRYACDKNLVRRIIRRKVAQIRYCYERALRRAGPGLQGRVVLRWKIGPSGRVESVAITQDTLNDSQVSTCIRAKIAQWRFPAPRDGGSCVVSYPFVFRRTP